MLQQQKKVRQKSLTQKGLGAIWILTHGFTMANYSVPPPESSRVI